MCVGCVLRKGSIRHLFIGVRRVYDGVNYPPT